MKNSFSLALGLALLWPLAAAGQTTVDDTPTKAKATDGSYIS